MPCGPAVFFCFLVVYIYIIYKYIYNQHPSPLPRHWLSTWYGTLSQKLQRKGRWWLLGWMCMMMMMLALKDHSQEEEEEDKKEMHVKLFWQRILRLWGLDHRRYDLTCIYIYILFIITHIPPGIQWLEEIESQEESQGKGRWKGCSEVKT